jgi:hypothetical protein
MGSKLAVIDPEAPWKKQAQRLYVMYQSQFCNMAATLNDTGNENSVFRYFGISEEKHASSVHRTTAKVYTTTSKADNQRHRSQVHKSRTTKPSRPSQKTRMFKPTGSECLTSLDILPHQILSHPSIPLRSARLYTSYTQRV